MKFINASVFTGGHFVPCSFEIENGRFSRIEAAASGCGKNAGDETDLQGTLVLPGLVDLHGHGNSGYDFSTCDLDGLKVMASYLGKHGITSFAPTSMTMPYSALEKAYANAKELSLQQQEGTNGMSRLAGINMEGPFFSHGKRGAQNPDWLKEPDFPAFLDLYEKSGRLIRLVDIAPELNGAMDFISQASRLCTVSVAHTEADYDTVRQAFSSGASQMTHLFNGMKGIAHRDPGPVCAAYDTPDVYVELICDGIHIAPPVIRMVFDLFKDRVILISDALPCCGMPDGTYPLGDQEIHLKEQRATLSDGTLAGSASNVFDMLRNVVSYGIPLEKALPAATINPAVKLGLSSEIGSIEAGKKADFLICSEDLTLQAVYIDGQQIA